MGRSVSKGGAKWSEAGRKIRDGARDAYVGCYVHIYMDISDPHVDVTSSICGRDMIFMWT